MRYTFFEFENFKGIRHARIDLSAAGSAARVYTLVGLNESGKTTALAGIDQFQATSESEEDVSPKQLSGWVAPDPHSLIPIAERTNFNDEITIRCGITLDDNDEQAARKYLRRVADGYRLLSLNRNIEIVDRYIYEDSKFVRRHSSWTGLQGSGYARTGKVLRRLAYAPGEVKWQHLAKFIRSELPTIWFFPNFLFDFPDRIFLDPGEHESPANRFYRALFQDVLDALERDLVVETHVLDRWRSDKPSDKENLDQVLLDAGRHVTRTVVSSWNKIFADKPISEKHVRIRIGEDADTEPSPDPRGPWVRFLLEDADGLFAISERSLGFRWFFVYLMLTTYRGRRAEGPDEMLFLFDEPASNLHPTAQKALLASLGDLSKAAIVIYTTHSHHLINPEWLGTTFVVANAGLDAAAVSTEFTAQRTDIRITPYRQFAAHHPEQSHFFQPILDVLDYAPSHVELVPDAVMVEGKSDFYLLAYFERVVQDVPDAERLSLMPGGGAGTLDDVIQLYIGWSRPFVALLDSDPAGRAAAQRYIDKFGPIVEPHLVGLADASGKEGVKGIESLLTKGDILQFQRIVDPASADYHKKTLARGIQEALVARRTVKLSASATKGLEKILSALRTRLKAVAAEIVD